jgi:hypothetical protein
MSVSMNRQQPQNHENSGDILNRKKQAVLFGQLENSFWDNAG